MIIKSTDAQSRKKSAVFSLEQLASPEYSTMLPLWDLCDDCFQGELAIKSRDERYIYRPSSKRGAKRAAAWESFKGRGKFPDYPAETLEKMLGTLGSKPPDVVLNGAAAKLDFLREYATPMHDGLDALFLRVAENVLRSGRYCLLLEPDQGDEIGFHINEYRARKFLRAKVCENNGESYAKMVLLDTSSIEYDCSLWRDVYYPQITLLALTDATSTSPEVYYQAKFGGSGVKIKSYGREGNLIWDDPEQYSETMDLVFAMLEKFRVGDPDPNGCSEFNVPTKYEKQFDRIPFTCINPASLNFMRYERPPLLKLCLQCIHILNADCDHQQATYMTTDPTAVMIGGTTKEDIKIGADSILWLPNGGDFRFVSASGSGLQQQAENIKEMKTEAQNMGVSLAGTEGAINTSGVALEIVRNAQTAALRIINQNCGKAIEEQLRYAGKWIGMKPSDVSRDIKFTPSNDFAAIRATTQECSTVASSRELMQMTEEEVRKYMERNGIVDPRPWDEVKKELDDEKSKSDERRLHSVAGALGFSSPTDNDENGEPPVAKQPPQGA